MKRGFGPIFIWITALTVWTSPAASIHCAAAMFPVLHVLDRHDPLMAFPANPMSSALLLILSISAALPALTKTITAAVRQTAARNPKTGRTHTHVLPAVSA